MADLTEAEIQATIVSLNTTIKDLIDNPKTNYKVGEHEYKWADYLRVCRDLLTEYRSMLSALPAEETTLWREW